MDPAYYQTVGQWQEAEENADAADALRWYEEQAQIQRGMSDGSEQEYLSGIREGAASLRAGPQDQQ